MQEIVYTAHLKFRMKLRRIPDFFPKEIYLKADEHYLDVKTQHRIALKEMEFGGKRREMMVSYDEKADRVEIITVHPLKPYQKYHRVKTGRWWKL